MKILIIDDSAMQQRIAKIYLEKGEGHNVITADNGEQGLAAAAAENPDLILLDIEMPGMNGEEVIKKLKTGSSTASIPVIMCSASEDAKESELLALGAAGFIKKPHGFSTLKHSIRTMVPAHC